MGNFLSLPILVIAAALQTSFTKQIKLLGGEPDLVFLLVLAWAINADVEEGVLWAFVGGICLDLLSDAPTGASVLGMLILVFIISGLGRQLYSIGLVILVGLVLVGTLLQHFMFMLVVAFTGRELDWIGSITYVLLPTVVYNLFFIFPVYWFVRRVQRSVRRRGSATS